MLNVDDALGKLLAYVQPVEGSEAVPVADALDRVTAADIAAPVNLPPFDSSAMGRLRGRRRRLRWTAPARCRGDRRKPRGTSFQRPRFRHGCGAHFPPAHRSRKARTPWSFKKTRDRTPAASHSWRPRARATTSGRADTMSFRGTDIARKGDRLDAYRLSWLTACGIDRVEVKRRVNVAIFSTGDELMDTGTPLGPGQIYDSNRFALGAAHVRSAGKPHRSRMSAGRPPRNPRRSRARRRLRRHGPHQRWRIRRRRDYVRGIVEEIGRLEFYRIALKPGKPLAVGKIGDADFFGLPGNPFRPS